MEHIYIPRMSVLTTDKHVFMDLNKFVALTGYIPTPFAELDITQSRKQGNRVSRFLNYLRTSLKKDGDFEENVNSVTKLFSSEVKTEIKQLKKALLQKLEKHEQAMAELSHAKSKYLKSMAEIDHVKTTIENENNNRSSQNKKNEKQTRDLLKARRTLIKKWLLEIVKDKSVFEEKLEEEIQCRDEIQRISSDIEEEIVGILNEIVRTLMEKHNEYISEKEILRLSQQFYRQTCRTYTFAITQNDPISKEDVQRPVYETSVLNKKDIVTKSKCQSRISADGTK